MVMTARDWLESGEKFQAVKNFYKHLQDSGGKLKQYLRSTESMKDPCTEIIDNPKKEILLWMYRKCNVDEQTAINRMAEDLAMSHGTAQKSVPVQ